MFSLVSIGKTLIHLFTYDKPLRERKHHIAFKKINFNGINFASSLNKHEKEKQVLTKS